MRSVLFFFGGEFSILFGQLSVVLAYVVYALGMSTGQQSMWKQSKGKTKHSSIQVHANWKQYMSITFDMKHPPSRHTLYKCK